MITDYVVLVVLILLMALVPYLNGQVIIEEDVDDGATREIYEDNYHHVASGVKCSGTKQFLNIVIAAAINGAIVALDGDTGELIWQHNDDPLLKGTLSSSGPIEVGGTNLQLMPTLDGRLFSYAHQSNLIEPLPITTESLLESTVRLGRDAVAGGKSVSTTGINVVTGEVKYKCSPDSCDNGNTNEYSNYPTLLVKRISNSIRAMDSLRGTERWNLSTAELDLSLAGISFEDHIVPNAKFLLRPPDGVITAVNRYGNELWTTQIEGHIVNVWHVCGNSLHEISLFDPKNMYTTQYEVGHRVNHNMPEQSSLFYMGTSEGYPFIIQSPKSKLALKKKMRDIVDFDVMREITGPRLCSANAVTKNLAYEVEDSALLVVLKDAFSRSHSKMIEDKSTTQNRKNRGKLTIVANGDETEGGSKSSFIRRTPGVALIGTENLRSTSLINGGDYGYLVLDSQSCSLFSSNVPLPVRVMEHFSMFTKYFLGFVASGLIGAFYTFRRLKKRGSLSSRAIGSSTSTESEESENNGQESGSISSDQIVIQKLTKPLLAIENLQKDSSHCDAVINCSNKQEMKSPLNAPSKSVHLENDCVLENVDEDEFLDKKKEKNSLERSRTVSRASVEFYQSRFAGDFEVEKIIGHGGFGIVFRAKSITDANEYAVKRIAVADTERARNRVLREARALAKFDHPGIIRYFHCWEERPPRGFQEKEDENLLGKIKADKLKKLRANKAKRNGAGQASNVKSAESGSYAMSFEMPPVVGHTEDEWSADLKPQKIAAMRTTSESKRGLAASGGISASINGFINEKSKPVDAMNGEEISSWSSSSSSSSETDTSSSSDEDEDNQIAVASSSGGIHFVGSSTSEDEQKVNKKFSELRQELSLQNRAVIVEDENEELEVRQASVPGDCAYLYIVMQLCEERTLENWIKNNKSKESRQLVTMKQWIKQLASALAYLHEKGFIHRDLKPGNIFFSLESKPNKKILKIGDLGLATKTDGNSKLDPETVQSGVRHTRNVGTRSYMSPEQLSHQRYTEKVDIFALGLVATEMIIPFATAMERLDTFSAYQKGVVPQILEENHESQEFLMQLTDVNIAKRPSAVEIENHPFLV